MHIASGGLDGGRHAHHRCHNHRLERAGVRPGSSGIPSLHDGPASGPAARLVGRAEEMIWILRLSDASMAWALEVARVWRFLFGGGGGGLGPGVGVWSGGG